MVAAFRQDCHTIVNELDRTWQWDDRLETVLTTYSGDENEAVLTLLDRVFSSSWTSQTLPSAPEDSRRLVYETAGLDNGQLFYHSAVEEGSLLFAAVWPWGNGKTISLRIGCRAPDQVAAQELLKSWFNLG